MSKQKRLIPQVRECLRFKQYSYATEKTYVRWILRFIRFHRCRHPQEMGEEQIRDFLSHLANDRNVSASTQNQALNAIMFLYRVVLRKELGDFSKFARAKRPKLLPTVLTSQEVRAILEELSGVPFLMVAILYGGGLRLKECLRLRVKDIDFERRQLWIRQSKGKKDRVVPLPEHICEALAKHLERVKAQHKKDLSQGFGEVFLPNALERKYPNAKCEWEWQYVFPAHRISRDPRSGKLRRHHLYDDVLGRHVKQAAKRAGIHKKVNVHCFRHSFATNLLEKNHDIRTVQQLLGHADLKTTMIYTHVTTKGIAGVQSPLDGLSLTAYRLEEQFSKVPAKKQVPLASAPAKSESFRLRHYVKVLDPSYWYRRFRTKPLPSHPPHPL